MAWPVASSYNAGKMKDANLHRLAEQTGIPIQKIAQWHFAYGSQYAPDHYSHATGRRKRPKGTLALSDIVRKYRISYLTLQNWRQAGLRSQRKGHMTLIKESDLKKWVKTHPPAE